MSAIFFPNGSYFTHQVRAETVEQIQGHNFQLLEVFICAAEILHSGMLPELPKFEWKILLRVLHCQLLRNWSWLNNPKEL